MYSNPDDHWTIVHTLVLPKTIRFPAAKWLFSTCQPKLPCRLLKYVVVFTIPLGEENLLKSHGMTKIPNCVSKYTGWRVPSQVWKAPHPMRGSLNSRYIFALCITCSNMHFNFTSPSPPRIQKKYTYISLSLLGPGKAALKAETYSKSRMS